MTNRRGFLGSIFAAAAAPVFVRAESLMKIYVPPQEIVLPTQGILTEEAMYEELSASYGRNMAKSSIMTRQQMIDDLLPKLNKLFEIEYNRHTEKNT
jgi:hypothetical protein